MNILHICLSKRRIVALDSIKNRDKNCPTFGSHGQSQNGYMDITTEMFTVKDGILFCLHRKRIHY